MRTSGRFKIFVLAISVAVSAVLFVSGCQGVSDVTPQDSVEPIDTADTGDTSDTGDTGDTGNPAEIPHSDPLTYGCGNPLHKRLAGAPPAESTFQAEDYLGLSCRHWIAQENGLRVEYLGVSDRCSDIVPSITTYYLGPSEIRFHQEFSEADCMCCYNYAIEIPADKIEMTKDLVYCSDTLDPAYMSSADYIPEPCNGEQVFPLSAKDEDVTCWAYSDSCGARVDGMFAECRIDTDSSELNNGCAEGLSCAFLDDPWRPYRCLLPCTTDTDCPVAVLSCTGGFCQL